MTAAETLRMELAYQIQKHLYESRLTAEVFAQSCGVPEGLVYQAIEEKSIPIEAVQKICGRLGISVDSLRRVPMSGSFAELQQLVLDTVQPGYLCSYQNAAKEIVDALGDVPLFEQSRNLRWLKQTVEYPEMYMPPKAQKRTHWKRFPLWLCRSTRRRPCVRSGLTSLMTCMRRRCLRVFGKSTAPSLGTRIRMTTKAGSRTWRALLG